MGDHLLWTCTKLGHLGAILGLGRDRDQRHQVAERVHGHVNLAALVPLLPVIVTVRSALRGALQRLVIEHHRRRFLATACRQQPQQPQVVQYPVEAAGREPALCLPVNHRPRPQIVRQPPPLATGLDELAQPVEHLPRRSTRCGAASVIRLKYAATKAHSSSLTSLGYRFRAVHVDFIPQL
jgi:hypothetical protein